MLKKFLLVSLLINFSVFAYSGDYKSYLENRCINNNEGWACNTLGWIYLYDYPRDVQKALQFFKNGCDLNFSYACGGLGYIYKYEFKDREKALKFLKKACSLGDKWAESSWWNF